MILEHFVVEDGEVESESELDGVASGELDGVGLFVSLLGLLLNLFESLVLGVLGDVAVVVTDHLDEEGLGLVGAAGAQDLLVDHVDNLLAVSLELFFNLALVLQKRAIELRVLGVLLDGRDGAAGGSLGRDQVLESDGQKVALVGVDGATLLAKDGLKEVDHVVKTLSLLGDAGEENLLFDVNHLCVVSELSGI